MAVNYDTFLIARQKLIDAISIPDYYMDYIDESKNLDIFNRDCCPLHDEDSPSFFYIQDRGMFHCFGCDKKGAVTELHYHIQKRLDNTYTKTKAILDLAKMYNVKIPNIFKSADLNDIKKFSNHSKLSFKPKDQLIKPRKKIESDMEREILKYKDFLTIDQLMDVFDDLDEVFFRDADVVNDIKLIKSKLNKYLERELME